MSETSELFTPPALPVAEQEKPERRTWPLAAGLVIGGVILVTGVVAGLGVTGALIAGGCVAGAVVGGVVLWRLPQLRRHFGRPRRASRSALSRTRRVMSSVGGGRKGKLPSLGRGKGKLRSLGLGGKGLLGGKGRGGGKGLLGKPKAAGKGLLGKGRAGGRSLLGRGKAGGKSLLGNGKAGGRSLLGKGRAGGKSLLGGKGKGLLGGGKGRGGGKGLLGHRTGKGVGSAAKRLLPKLPGGKGRQGGGGAGGGKRRLLPRIPGLKRKPGGRTAPGGKTGTGTTGRKAGRGPLASARRVGAGTRKAFRQARRITGGKTGIGGVAAALPLVPFVAGWAGAKRLRAWIKKRRGGDPQPPPQEKTPEPQEAPESVPDRKPGLPLTPNETDHPAKRRSPVSNQLEAAAESIDSGIGSFEPENVNDLGLFLGDLPRVYEALAGGLNRVADRFAEEFPLHPSVVEHIREMAAGAAGQHEYAGEAYQIFLTAHQEDLDRIENPRTGEEFMDVSKQ